MDEFLDGADGVLGVPVVVEDDTGEQVGTTLTTTYDAGLIQARDFNQDSYIPAEFAAGK